MWISFKLDSFPSETCLMKQENPASPIWQSISHSKALDSYQKRQSWARTCILHHRSCCKSLLMHNNHFPQLHPKSIERTRVERHTFHRGDIFSLLLRQYIKDGRNSNNHDNKQKNQDPNAWLRPNALLDGLRGLLVLIDLARLPVGAGSGELSVSISIRESVLERVLRRGSSQRSAAATSAFWRVFHCLVNESA